MLQARRQEAEARWPRPCRAITRGLAQLAEYEAAGCEDLDLVSGCFGDLMAELFDYKQDRWSPELRAVGANLGKYIYLLDAWDDLPRDLRRGSYNPLKSLSAAPDYEEQMREIFELLLAQAAAAFRRLPCVEDARPAGKHPLFRRVAEISCGKPAQTVPMMPVGACFLRLDTLE